MRAIFCLMVLALLGAGLLLLPNQYQTYPEPLTAPGPLRLWLETLRFFSVPLCLLILRASRYRLVGWLRIAWGVWGSLLSLLVLLSIHSTPPFIFTFGSVPVVMAVLTFYLGTALFSAMALIH